MVGFPAARRFDMTLCPQVTPVVPPVPHVGGPIMAPCSPNVIIGYMHAARVTDMAICVGPPDFIAKGSVNVFINFLMAARMFDPMVHGGKIMTGCPTVLIGESGASGGGGGNGFGAGLAAVAALLKAAVDGKPFCEECFQKAMARAGA